MKKIVLYISSAVLLIIALTFSAWLLFSNSSEEDVYIALVGDMTPGNKSGEEMQNGVKLYLDKVNKMGGVNGREIKLLVVNDKNDPKHAIEAASRIAESKDVLMVLGHGWASASLPAGRVYKKYGIPALTASSMDPSVTAQNDWYFRTISDTNFSGQYLANYVKTVLKQKTACLIWEDSYYGKGFLNSFETAARRLELQVKRNWSYSIDGGNLDEEFEQIVSDLRSEQNPGMICLMGNEVENARLVTFLRKSGKKYSIIITDPFLQDSFNLFNDFPEETSSPGYFSNGIYTLGFFIGDIANEKADAFRKEYFDKYGMAPEWLGAYYYDAAVVAIDALKKAEIQGIGHVRRDRREIKKALENMYNPDTGIKGLRGYIYFDETGASNGPLPVGFYQNNKLLPAFTQYQLKGEDSSDEDVIKKALSGELIFVDNRVMSKIRLVYADIDINEISGLDQKKSIYYADFYLKFRFEEDFDEVSDILFPNAVEPIELGDPVTREKNGNIETRVYHIKSYFKVDFDFYEYPFDRQDLKIEFKHAKLTRDRLIYIADAFGVPDVAKGAVKLKGWGISRDYFNEHIMSKASAHGGFGLESAIYYSKCVAGVTISKQTGGIILKVFSPIIMLLLILYMMYFVGIDKFLVRMMIPLSVLIAVSFYHIRLLSHLGVEYMTALEYAYFTIYILVVLNLGMTLLIHYFHKRKEDRKATLISYAGMTAHPLISLILFCWFMF